MTHGSFDKASLLSNLLGAAGNTAAGAKKIASQHQGDAAQRFQEAMQKARPEVAAREPAKRPEPVKRTEPARSDLHAARDKADEQIRAKHSAAQAQQDERVKAARAQADSNKAYANRPDPSERLNNADKLDKSASLERAESQIAEQNNSEAATATDKSKVDSAQTDASSADQLQADDIHSDTLSSDTTQSDTQELLAAGQQNGELLAELLTDEEGTVIDNPLLNLLFAEGVPVTEEATTELSLATATEELASSDLLLSTTETAANVELLAADAMLETEATGLDKAAALVGGLAASLVQGAGALANSKTSTAGVSGGFDANSGLAADAEAAELSLTESLDVALTSEAEGSDTPDSLMGTKTAFSKLMDLSLLNAGNTGDKMAPVLDGAKVATTPAAGNPALDVLARLSEAQSSPAARAFVVQTGVNVPVGQPQWSQAVGDKVLWLAAQNVSAAEIRLDPPDLGPMSVKVSVNQDQASVSFTSPHPIVREALDQQLNRLREMFAEQGLNLINVDVSDKSFAQQEREKNESGKGSGGLVEDEDELQPVAVTTVINTRLVDHYA